MNKELLNKILPYCGYELKYQGMGTHDCDFCDNATPSTITFAGMDIQDKICTFNGQRTVMDVNKDEYYYFNQEAVCHDIESEVFPILFSPDCLTREIKTEYGKEIPLIEMAKINDKTLSNIIEIETNEDGKYCSIKYHTDVDDSIICEFIFCLDTYSFEMTATFDKKSIEMKNVPIRNRPEVADKNERSSGKNDQEFEKFKISYIVEKMNKS